MKFLVVLLLGVVLLSSCVQKKKEPVQALDTGSMMHEVTVKKSLQANAYTYLQVDEGDQTYWIAVAKMSPEIGKTYFFANAMEMNDFKSTDLDTVFAQVFFVDKLGTDKSVASPAMDNPHGAPGRKDVALDETIEVEPAEGGVTVAQLLGNKADYKDENVIVRGVVVKVNPDIMNRNWVHIQDGTDADGAFDLTLTTLEYVKVGDLVTMEGKVALDKDFGAGYFYDLIVEEATMKK